MHAPGGVNASIITEDPQLIARLRSCGVACSDVAPSDEYLPGAYDVIVVDTRATSLPLGECESEAEAVVVAIVADASETPEWADDAWLLSFTNDEIAAHWRLAARLAALRKENRRLLDELKQTATTDPLTGLLNRNGLLELLGHVWARSRRSGRPLACVMFDLDRFKQVNDRHGHLAGDAAIVEAAKAIRLAGREGDVAARYGGDEFCVLLPECDLAAAELRARRTLEEIAEIQIPTEGPPIQLSASYGAAVASPDHRVSTELIHAADMALLAAKRREGTAKGRAF